MPGSPVVLRDGHRTDAERLLGRAVEEEARRSAGRIDPVVLLGRARGALDGMAATAQEEYTAFLRALDDDRAGRAAAPPARAFPCTEVPRPPTSTRPRERAARSRVARGVARPRRGPTGGRTMADYHDGELAVQYRAGLHDPATGSLRAIRDAVPEAAAVFLARQPMIVVGAADASGRLWSTLLTGEPGFLGVPDPRTLTIGALPAADDPLGAVLRESGTRVGLIAIEPATRRRIRLNGTSVPEADGVRVALDQVIGNCPKYLQKRNYALLPPDRGGRRTAIRRGDVLTTVQQLTLATSDSFFIATASPDGDADASHRGGNPGFLQVLSPTRLRWPDYAGNAMFLTLGNLELHPQAGLLVPDWETGALLQLSGTAHTVWDGAEAAAVPGAQRIVEFRIEAVQETQDAVPLRWSEPDFSRFNPPVVPG